MLTGIVGASDALAALPGGTVVVPFESRSFTGRILHFKPIRGGTVTALDCCLVTVRWPGNYVTRFPPGGSFVVHVPEEAELLRGDIGFLMPRPEGDIWMFPELDDEQREHVRAQHQLRGGLPLHPDLFRPRIARVCWGVVRPKISI